MYGPKLQPRSFSNWTYDMRIYNIRLAWEIVSDGPAEPLDLAWKVAEYLKCAWDDFPEQEAVFVIPLNAQLYPKGRMLCTLGLQSEAPIHPREIFRLAIVAGADSVIISHNHPGGDPSPSTADLNGTAMVKNVGMSIGIPLRDHVIIGRRDEDPCGLGYYSFKENHTL